MASFQNGGKKLKKNSRRNILGCKAPTDLIKCDMESQLNSKYDTFTKGKIPPETSFFLIKYEIIKKITLFLSF